MLADKVFAYFFPFLCSNVLCHSNSPPPIIIFLLFCNLTLSAFSKEDFQKQRGKMVDTILEHSLIYGNNNFEISENLIKVLKKSNISYTSDIARLHAENIRFKLSNLGIKFLTKIYRTFLLDKNIQ